MVFKLGKTYTREELGYALGGNRQSYLPRKGDRVLFAAVTREDNPEAPRVILAGQGPEISKSAKCLARQPDAVPVFIKQQANAWEYVGHYRVISSSENPKILEEYRQQSGRDGTLTRVLFLELVSVHGEQPA